MGQYWALFTNVIYVDIFMLVQRKYLRKDLCASVPKLNHWSMIRSQMLQFHNLETPSECSLEILGCWAKH